MPPPRVIPAHANRPRAGARAFTLLEILLAVVLGALVLSTAMGVFVALQRSDRHNRLHLRDTIQLSLAHRACELALRTMILSNSRPPAPEVEPGAEADALARAARLAEAAAVPPTEFERPRVLLSRDPNGPSMIWTASDGSIHELAPQRLEITIERPPVFAEPEPGEQYTPVVRRMYASRRERDRDRRREERDAERATGESGEPDNPFDATEPAIAAGVRGVFELTWEPQDRRPAEPAYPEGGSWTLWWRTIPPIVAIPGADTTEGLSLDDLERNPMYRPVKLASDLRWAKWEAVRAGETVAEFQSTWWEDLPAYVTLEVQTMSGKWSKWMFEVQGTRGPEPGTVIGQELIADESAVDAAVEAALGDGGRPARNSSRPNAERSGASGSRNGDRR